MKIYTVISGEGYEVGRVVSVHHSFSGACGAAAALMLALRDVWEPAEGDDVIHEQRRFQCCGVDFVAVIPFEVLP